MHNIEINGNCLKKIKADKKEENRKDILKNLNKFESYNQIQERRMKKTTNIENIIPSNKAFSSLIVTEFEFLRISRQYFEINRCDLQIGAW